MGAAAVRASPLGAEIHVLDLKEPPVDVASYQSADLRDPDAVAAAVGKIGGRIDALFNCAGLPGTPFSDVDTMLVNFAATWLRWSHPHAHRQRDRQHLVDRGGSYLTNIEKWLPLVETPTLRGEGWIEAHPTRSRAATSRRRKPLHLDDAAAMDFAPKESG
jgi:NAD(P)-dependent dehydrogenase (short-subunit alcohol dehydrogenase family)